MGCIPLKKDKNNEIICKRAKKLCLLGLGDKELAKAFGVDVTTIEYWKKERPGFKEALRAGKQEADTKVVNALYEKAVGYSHKETKVFLFQGDIITQEIDKIYPPDTTACLFWLKNRTRHLIDPWSDVTKHEITGKDGMPLSKTNQLDLSDFTDAELEMMERMSVKIKNNSNEETGNKARNRPYYKQKNK